MISLDGEEETTCDCKKDICLHRYVIDHYSDCISEPALLGGEPEAFLVLYGSQRVDYLFSVNKQGVHAPYNAAKRTIVKRASGKWVCKSCPRSG